MALMNNFDFYLENLDTAKNSDGALNEQQKIYEESWLAASKRVKASIEDIYSSLIDDEFFIKLTNGFSKLLDGLNAFIDGLGGLKGTLLFIGSLITKIFHESLASGINSAAVSLKTMTTKGQQAYLKEQIDIKKTANDALRNSDELSVHSLSRNQVVMNTQMANVQDQLIEKTEQLAAEGNKISNQDNQRITNLKDQLGIIEQQVQAVDQMEEENNQQARREQFRINDMVGSNNIQDQTKNFKKRAFSFGVKQSFFENHQYSTEGLDLDVSVLQDELKERIAQGVAGLEEGTPAFEQAMEKMQPYKDMLKAISAAQEELTKQNKEMTMTVAQGLDIIEAEAQKEQVNMANNIDSVVNTRGLNLTPEQEARIREYFSNLEYYATQSGEAVEKSGQYMSHYNNKIKELGDSIGGAIPQQKDFGENFAEISSSVMMVSSAMSAVSGLTNTLMDDFTSGEDKLKSFISQLPALASVAVMAINSINVAVNSLKKATLILAAISAAIAILTWGYNKITEAMHAQETVTKQAKQALEDYKSIVEQTNQKWEELQETLNNYDENVKSLNKLTEGTQEWKEQVEALNLEILEALNKFPQLAQYITRNEKGILEISDTGREILEEQQKRQEQQQMQTQILLQKNANQEDINTNKEKIDSLSQNDLFYDFIKDADQIKNKALKKVLDVSIDSESFDPSTGTYKSSQTQATVKDVFNVIKDQFEKQGETAFADEDILTALDWIAKITGESAESIKDAFLNNKQLENVNSLLDEQLVLQTKQDDKDYQNTSNKTAMDNYLKAQSKEINNKLDEIDWLKGKSEEDKHDAILKQYIGEDAKKQGYYISDNAIKDKSGKDVYTKEAIQNMGGIDKLAANSFKQEEYNKQIEKIDLKEQETKIANATRKYITAGLDAASEGVQAAVASTLNEEAIDWSKFTEEEYQKVKSMEAGRAGREGKDFSATKTGKSMAEFENKGGRLGATSDSYSDLRTSFEEASEQLKSLQDNYDNIIKFGLENYSEAQKKAISEDLIAKQEEVDQLKGLMNGAQEYYKNLNEEDKKLFAEKIDFKKAQTKELMDLEMEAARDERAENKLSEAATDYDLNVDSLSYQMEAFKKELKATGAEFDDLSDAAADMAIANQRLNKGVDKLTDSWDDWKKTLKSANKTTQDYAEACVGVEEALRDMLSLSDESVIPKDFLESEENIGLLDEIANGSEEAVQKLAFNLTKAQIEAEQFSGDIAANMAEAFDFEPNTDYEATFEAMKIAAIDALTDIQNAANGVDIGKNLTDPSKQAEWAAALNQYALAAKWTTEQMEEALSSVGVRANITYAEGEPVSKMIPHTVITRKRIKDDPDTGEQEWEESSYVDHYEPITEPTLIPQIQMEDPENPKGQTKPVFQRISMGNIAPSATSSGKDKSSSKGGGSGSKNNKKNTIEHKKPELLNLDEEIERYKEIKEVLSDYERQVDQISKKKERAWGADKLKLIEEERKAILKNKDAQLEYIKQIDANLTKDALPVLAMGGIFDEEGRLTNDTELRASIVEQYNNAETIRTTKINEIIDKINVLDDDDPLKEELEEEKRKLEEDDADWWNDWKESQFKNLDQYVDTLNLSEEAKEQFDEYIRKIQDLNYDEINLKAELKLELADTDIKIIGQQITRLEADATKAAERIALTSSQITPIKQSYTAIVAKMQELDRQYQAGSISQQAYYEGITGSLDELYEQENKIREAIVAVGEELQSIIDEVSERLSGVRDEIDNVMSGLEHYKNVLEMTGGAANNYQINKILKGQQEIIEKQYESDKATLDLWERKRMQQELEMENMTEGTEAWNEANKILEDLKAKEQEAKENVWADIEQLGELIKEVFNNALEQAEKDFEEDLFGRSLESMQTSIDRLNERQENLLTTTNKIYETNKLIRSVENDIANTSNKRAKQAYEEYKAKVQSAQEQNELSEFQLSLLQAEYEVTKAKIALEEAQDAKDTVRLKRDAEGNFGYVYTANQDKIDDAQQALDDAENSYYNTALEGAKEYQDAWYANAEAHKEAVKEIAQQLADGEIDQSEHDRRLREINTTYYETAKQIQANYNLATAALAESSYTGKKDYILKGIQDYDDYVQEMEQYEDDLEEANENYEDSMEDVEQKAGEVYGSVSSYVKEATDKTKNLYNENDTIITQFDGPLSTAISNANDAWGELLLTLQNIVKELTTINTLGGVPLEQYVQNAAQIGASDDLHQDLINLANDNYDFNDPEVQKTLAARWQKVGGEADETNYKELRDQYAEGSAEYNAYDWIRKYKLLNTDWMGQIQKKLLENGGDITASEITWRLDAVKDKIQLQNELGLQTVDYWDWWEQLTNWMNEQGFIKTSFASGGYTGVWGPEGRIATLHEKELVLNADDTENILTSVGMVREISKALDGNTVAQILEMTALNAAGLPSAADQVVQQQVEIHADFPNVQDHNEIELAIDNLINAASQYAFRS